jgi:hypothetical protein
LVDAKNHWYTIDKALRRQLAAKVPVRQIHALTHSIFDFSDRNNFRRETFMGIVQATRDLADREGLRFQAATLADIADAYRRAVPCRPVGRGELKLDPNSMARQVGSSGTPKATARV